MTSDIRQWIQLIEGTLTEMPISGWQIGPDFVKRAKEDDPNYPFFGKTDTAVITEPSRIEKIKTAFRKCPFKFNVLFYHLPLDGELDGDYDLDRNAYQSFGRINDDDVRIRHNDLRNILQNFKEKDAINFILTNNMADKPISLASGWMLAHRIGHALLKTSIVVDTDVIYKYTKTLIRLYNNDVKVNLDNSEIFYSLAIELMSHICKFKSARDKKISTIEFEELSVEFMAQYIIKGQITFNPLPETFKDNRLGITMKKPENGFFVDDLLTQMQYKLNLMYHSILENAVGKVWMD